MPKEIKVSYQWYIYGMRLFYFFSIIHFKTHPLCFIAKHVRQTWALLYHWAPGLMLIYTQVL